MNRNIVFALVATFSLSASATVCTSKGVDDIGYGHKYQPFISQFEIIPTASGVVMNKIKVGPGWQTFFNDNFGCGDKCTQMVLPAASTGLTSKTRNPLPAGVSRYSRFKELESAAQLTFTLQVNANGTAQGYWRSSDDGQWNESFTCK